MLTASFFCGKDSIFSPIINHSSSRFFFKLEFLDLGMYALAKKVDIPILLGNIGLNNPE